MRKWSALILLGILFSMALPAYAQQIASQTGESQQTNPLVVAPELFNRGGTALDTQSYDRAVLDFSLFILLNPTVSEGYFYRGQSYEALGNLDSALADLSTALELPSSSKQYTSAVYFTRAQLYIQKNDLQAALNDLNASIEAFPAAVESLTLRARLYAYQRRFEDALTDFGRIIELQPDNASAYLQRGSLNFQMQNLESALNDFNRAIAINPDNPEGYVDRAILHNVRSNYESALADLNSAISLRPNDGGLYLLRGTINARVDKSTDAASDYLNWINLSQTQRFTSRSTFSTSQSFTVEMGEGWVYDIPFEAKLGQTVSVRAIRMPNSQADPLLIIVDAVGTPLIADDDSGGQMDASIQDYAVPADGRYSVLITHALGGATGNIGVSLDFGVAETTSENQE